LSCEQFYQSSVSVIEDIQARVKAFCEWPRRKNRPPADGTEDEDHR
jgi:hypothetical protein